MGTLKVFFTGLCAYLPDVDLEDPDPTKNPTKMMVLQPDVRDVDGKVALDSRCLRQHFPIVRFNVSSLSGGAGGMVDELLRWDIPRKEISFRLDEIVPESNKFNVVQRLRKIYNSEDSKKDFNHGVHIREIWKDSKQYKVRPECFQDVGSLGTLAARVKIDKGRLYTHKLDKNIDFSFSNSLGMAFGQRPLSNIATLKFVKVRSVTLVARDMDNNVEPKYVTFKTKGQHVKIFIANDCCELREKPAGAVPPQRIPRDKDFRAFYSLFDGQGRTAISGALAGVSLPLPVPCEFRGGSGLKPVQCMRLSLNAQDFS